MTDFTAYLRLGVDSRDAVSAQKDLDRMAAAGAKADKSFTQLSGTSRLLGASIGGIGLAAATAQVINYADAWTNVENVLIGVSDSAAAYAVTQAKVLSLSKDTFSSLQGTASLYSEITRSVSELGINQDRIIGVTRTINNLFLAGGKAASETAGAVRQLSQGLASGALRGDEFNSVAEGAPRILDALSQSLDLSKGELREFAATGSITAGILIDALEDYSDEAQKAVDTTIRTFSQSSELARTFALEFVGASDGIKEFSATAGSALVTVAQNLDLVSDAVIVLSVAYGARLAGSLATATAAKVSSIASARTLAIAENDAAVGIARRATVEAAAAKATLDKARADSVAATATLNNVRANGLATQSVAPLITALNAQAVAQQRLSAAIGGSAAAASAANAANAKLAATDAAVAGTNLLSTSMRGLSGALALVGGPAGVAILAAGALVYFATRASEAEKILEGLNPELDGLTERFEALGFYQQQLARSELAGNIEDQKNKIAALVEQLESLREATERDSQGFFSSYQRDLMVEVAAKIEAAEKSLAGMQSQFTSIKPPTDKIQGFVDSIASLNNVLGFFVSGDGVSKQFSLFADGAGKVKSFSEEYQKLSADIEQQIALFGDEKKSSEIAYLARTGQLKKMSADEAALLVERYKALELQKETADKTKELTDAEKSRSESVASSIAELEKQNALFGEQSKYAEIIYSIESGLLKVTEAEKARYLAAAQTNDQLVANKNLADSIESFAKKSEEDKAALDELITSVDEFGGAWSRTGSIVADSLGTISDALNDYSSQMVSIAAKEAKLADARKKFVGDPKELEKISKAEKKLASERTSANLKSFSTITSAFGQMFDEQSKERKALNNAEKVFTAIEIGLAMQKAGANALTAITSAFSAPFPVNFAAGAAMIGIMAGLGVFGGGGGGGGAPTAEDIQASQGTGTVLGDADGKSESIINALESYSDIGLDQLGELRGIRDALTGLNSGIALLARDFISGQRFTGAEVGGLGSSQKFSVGDFAGKEVYDFLNPLGADILNRGLKDLFGSTKKSLKDTGLKVGAQDLGSVLAGDLELFYYNTVETTKKKLFGLSKKTSTKDELTAADADIAAQFDQIFTFIGTAVSESIGSLGIKSANAIENFKISIGKVSFKDLSGEEIQSELEAIFSQQADLITEFIVPAMKEYQQIGEGTFETLTRVAQEMATFNYYTDALGLSFSLTGLSAIDAQQSIAEFSGGMDKLTANLQSYYQEFFTEEERAANQMKLLSAEFKNLGYDTVPTSRDAFRDLVDGIDLTTSAGQKQFASLIALSEVFAELTPIVDDLAESGENAANAALSLLQRSVAAEKKIIGDQVAILNTALGSSRAVFNALESSLKGMVISSASTQAATRRQAQAQLSGMLASARGGNLPNIDDLTGALSVISKPSENLYSTFEDYATDFYRTAADIKALQDIAGEQISTDELALSELEKQSAFLNEIVAWGSEQVDILNGVDNSVATVADALKNLSSIIGVTYPTAEQNTMLAQLAASTTQARDDLKTSQMQTEQAIVAQGAQMKDFGEYVKASQLAIADNTDKIRKLLDKFDIIGIPLRDETIDSIVDPIVEAVTP